MPPPAQVIDNLTVGLIRRAGQHCTEMTRALCLPGKSVRHSLPKPLNGENPAGEPSKFPPRRESGTGTDIAELVSGAGPGGLDNYNGANARHARPVYSPEHTYHA